ncbi:MAG TPA: response regulator [Bryobacteraceae bacterium]|nr:response regulator [Bryobacteraceae bacterium]
MHSYRTTILNVDDHVPARYARTRLLKQAGFKVDEAGTGEDAMDRVLATRPGLVLLDVNLPDISGFEVCRRIKSHPVTASTTVLYLTASAASAEDKIRAYDGGAAAYLVEPVEPEVLLATVRALAREHEADMARQRLAALVESSDDAIIANGLDGSIQHWNVAAQRMYGYSEEEAKRLTLEALFSLERVTEYPAIMERLRRGECVQSFETVHARKDGGALEVALTVSPVRDAAGTVVSGAVIARDIGERKRMEAHLLRSQKLESIGALAGGIAHDFNNLLTGVLGNASLVLDELPPSHRARPLVEEVLKAGERAAHLTAQMLAYAGMGRFVLASVDISKVVAESRGLLEATISRNIELRFDLDPDLPLLDADPTQIQQLLVNLTLNAAEAIGPERTGAIRIVTRAEPTHEEGGRRGVNVCLEVSDDGCGMDEQVLARMYDPFFTTKFMGRGLGLSAASGIVRAHHGAIRVESTPGEGTAFHVQLPASSPKRERGRQKLLVVDDEEVVRLAARAVLEKHGFEVLLAEDGIAAMQLFERDPAGFSAVLLDLTMPGMSGEHVVPRLRALRRDVSILLMSGYDERMVMERLGTAEVSGFLHKPYTSSQLAERVKALVAAA